MRTYLLVTWLSLPALGVAYHYGPGQDRLKLDEAARLVAVARAEIDDEDYERAAKSYAAALAQLPAGHKVAAWSLRLEKAKAQMLAQELPAAAGDLQSLVEEVEQDQQASEELRQQARLSLANAQFYMTWLLRLEGKTQAEWLPQAEAARQNYRLLAERAQDDPSRREKLEQDLEATIRLERMELEDLQGLPLPSQ